MMNRSRRTRHPATLPELTNNQIDEHFAHNPHYSGCFPKDRLPSTRDLSNKFVFVNLQSSTQGNGTHWTLLFNCRPDCVIYFDSMGEVPPNEVSLRMRETNKKQIYNQHDFQPLNTSSCGWWCIYVANLLQKGKSLDEIVAHFHNSNVGHNEELLRNYFFSR